MPNPVHSSARADAPIAALLTAFNTVRDTTVALASRLTPEDMVLQSMPEASPAKWHLAHTAWFFEEFVLGTQDGYTPFHPSFRYLFNSYYDAVGDRHPRAARGLLSRPSTDEVFAYRRHVDAALARLLEAPGGERLWPLVELGLHHEQQHQELLLTDIKHALAQNVLRPAFQERFGPPSDRSQTVPLAWVRFDEGLHELGYEGSGFCFDNERPRHRVFVDGFELASRLVTAGEFLRFIEDGGYRRPELWLSEGFDVASRHGWTAPLYWELRDGVWSQFTLSGMRPVTSAEPVCHVSYFEADAYARWAGARLCTEFEWEVAAQSTPPAERGGSFLESEHFHPCASEGEGRLHQLVGEVWQWTSSAYAPYPGFRTLEGALGEYNGKFMCNQQVLRGGSFATPRSHLRTTYRNFFPAAARWQFSGVRLARDLRRER